MAITAFSAITLDKDEYSPYYRASLMGLDYGVINATINAIGVNGDIVYVALVNQENMRKVATTSAVLNNGVAVATFTIRHDAVDTDGVFRAKQGLYTIWAGVAADFTGLTYVSAQFPILPVPAIELKEIWLAGISLLDERNPSPQVQGLSGVTGLRVSDVQRGGYPLLWTNATRSLSFDNGPAAIIPSTGPATSYTLWNETMDQTITVLVNPTQVPAADTTGYIMVDYMPLADEFLRNQLRFAYTRLANQLSIPPEPLQAATDQIKSAYPNYDVDAWAATYHPPSSARRPVRFQTDVRRVQVLHEVGGYYGETKVLTIPSQIVSIDRNNGFIELVPSINGQFPAPTVAGFGIFAMYNMPYMGLPSVVPKFWQYCVTYGLENMDVNPYGSMAREYIARAATVEVLLLLGRAKISYLAGESFARDGGSISRSFTNGQYGVYSDIIGAHLQWLQTNGASLKRKITGILVSVSGR